MIKLEMFFASPALAVLVVLSVGFGVGLGLSGCGVRGNPQPPLNPPELGRGQPKFKRTSDESSFSQVPSPNATPLPRETR